MPGTARLWPMTAQAEEQEEQPQQTQEQSEEEFETELQNTINGLDLSDLQQGWEEDEMAQQMLDGGSFNDYIIRHWVKAKISWTL